jgi:hypothetical protein
VQLYLPKDDANTDIGTIFHEKLPDGSLPKKAQMRFAPRQRLPSRSATTPGTRRTRCTPE